MASRRIVLDSNVLIDALAYRTETHAFLSGISPQPWCSEISRVELLRGVHDVDRPTAEALFQGILWLPVDEAIARQAGELGRRWGRARARISAADLVIAATTLALDARLATSNVRHFPMFPDLQPPY